MNLGIALATLGERENGTEHLEQSVEAYRLALQEYTRAHLPLDWAGTQIGLGIALERLGEREDSTEHLGQAVEVYRLALQEITRERVPFVWARTQTNLGIALQALGERGSGTEYLDQAVAAYRLALQENTRARVPLDWAKTRFNLGLALADLYAWTQRADTAREALDCFQQVEPVLRSAGLTGASNEADQMINRLQQSLAKSPPGTSGRQKPPG
jgi:tetratricopeptide (TPR) repeat protein